MRKFFKTFELNIIHFFESYFKIPCIIALVAVAITLLLYFWVNKSKETDKRLLLNLLLLNSFGSFYFSELLYSTLFSRINTKINPLMNIWGEWSVFDGETIMFLNFRPLQNILLFVPLCLVIYLFSRLIKKRIKPKQLLFVTFITSFSLSLLIELMQLVTCLGTFQISDLVYNTLGGVLGALIVIFISKKRHLN